MSGASWTKIFGLLEGREVEGGEVPNPSFQPKLICPKSQFPA